MQNQIASESKNINTKYIPRLKKYYFEFVVPKMMEKFKYENPLSVPRLYKIVVNTGVGKWKGFNLVIEGAGGLLVPLRQKPLYTWRDLITELKLPTLVVSASYLGAINHTLLTVEALKKINLVGVVLNFPKPPKTIAEKTNKYTLKKILGEIYLGEIHTILMKKKLNEGKISIQDIKMISNINWSKIEEYYLKNIY
jgi:hypothetical protein